MNILKRDRELTGKELTFDELLDWRNRLSSLKSIYNCDEEEYSWYTKQIQYCDKEMEMKIKNQ